MLFPWKTLAVFVGLLAGVVGAVDDEPLGTTTRMVFDPQVNMVVAPEEMGRHGQSLADPIDQVFFEAENMNATATYIQLEWVTTRVGYPDLFPGGLPTEVPRPVANTSPYLSGAGVASILAGTSGDTMHQRVTITRGGSYVLWVRYQTIRQLPAPFEVVIEQGDRELLRQRFNEESKALDQLSARLLWEPTPPVELQPGEATIGLAKVPDEMDGPLRGPRYVDCMLLTNDRNYLPAGGDLLPGREGIRSRRTALSPAGDAPVLLWHKGRFEGFYITSWPTDPTQLNPAFEFTLPRNGHAHELLLVTSVSEKPLSFQAQVELVGETGTPFPGEVGPYVVAHMQSRYFGWVPQVLLHRDLVTVSPYHTVGLWLQVATSQAPPGTYRGNLILRQPERTLGQVPVKLRVLEEAIPEDPNLHVLLWGGGLPKGYPEERQPEMREKYWANALAHGWNVFRGTLSWSAEEARQRGIKAICIGASSNHEPGSKAFREELRTRLLQRVEAYRALGYRDQELWFEAFDEPSMSSSREWLEYAKVVREVAPEVRIWTNPGWQRHQREEVFREWARYVDVWWPFAGNLSVPELLRVMKQSGKMIGFYIERGWSGMNPAAAWCYFRRMPLLVAKYDLDGCGFWAADAYYEDPWDDLNTQTNYAKAAVYFPGTEGPINTINFQAWREGLDELLLLRALAREGKINPTEWADRFLEADSLAQQDTLRDALIERYAGG